MRIALVSTPFAAVPPRGYGGTELVVHELARGLSAAGHQVTLFATGDSRGPDVRWLFERPVWPPAEQAELRHCAAAARAIAQEGFDVVHAHAPAMLALAPGLGAPVVYTLHHAHDERLTRCYTRRPLVTYVAISARQAALEPELACELVHHGLDPTRHPPGDGRRDDAVFLGRLSPCKGPELAIEAARAAGVAIRLAGEVHAADATPEWAGRLRAALTLPRVEHLGPVSGERKLELLGGARALLMPILWEEPFGLVMIEAMLCGTPVIAFPRGAAPEIIDEGLTGFLVDSSEEMAAVLGQLRGFDRTACRRRAGERFGAGRMVRDYERVYRRVAAAWAPANGVEEPGYAG
ncbi:MAG TPA: glycosyltransferase family 4 protein [Anaeromyxobacteraceae bacterium]